MADAVGNRQWLGRGAVIGWIVLGVVGVLVAPEAEPPSPGSAEVVFGHAPSMHSSARAGTFAFARLLERMAYDVQIHQAAGRPSADVLMLLEPKIRLGDEEVAALIGWVRDGGALVYAPTDVSRAFGDDEEDSDFWEAGAEADDDSDDSGDTPDDDSLSDTDEADDMEIADSISDSLLLGLEAAARDEPRLVGTATFWNVDRGRVVILEGGAIALSNENLADEGISDELPWLRLVLGGKTSVAFDEGRLGFGGSEGGMWDMIEHSRFATAARLVLVALFLWVVARGTRRMPPQPDPPAGGRDFGEHIDAVGNVLRAGGRARLALGALLAGTRRRLGALAATDRARELFDGVAASQRERVGAATVARNAEALRLLETACGIAGHPEVAAAGRSSLRRAVADHARGAAEKRRNGP